MLNSFLKCNLIARKDIVKLFGCLILNLIMWSQTGQQNMPDFREFEYKQITKLIRLREVGRSSSVITGNSSCTTTSNGHYHDLNFVRSLLCNKQAYLEVREVLVPSDLVIDSLQ